MVRAKFVCVEKGLAQQYASIITEGQYLPGETKEQYLERAAFVRVVLKPVFGGSDENLRFANATSPDGECRMLILNKEAAKDFEIGTAYYLDFSPA